MMFAILLSACGKKNGSFILGEAVKTELDESKVVMNAIPKCLTLVNDSMAAMVCNRKYLSLFNIESGINLRNFSAENIRLDSLLNLTYNKYYEGKRVYLIDSAGSRDPEDGGFQMLNFSYDSGNYYVYLNGEVEVKYLNDSVALSKSTSDPKVKAAMEKYSATNLHFMEYVQFLFVLDEDFRLKRVQPLYMLNTIANDYSFCYQVGFGVNQGNVYVPVISAHWSAGNYRSKINDNGFFYSLAKQSLKDPDSCQLMLDNKEADYSDFSFINYLDAKRIFHRSGDEFYSSNGKEIRALTANEQALKKEMLKANEWISDFCIDDHTILLKTYTLSPKPHPTKMDVAYGIDTISAESIVIINRKEDTKQELPLPQKKTGTYAITAKRLICVERDKEHYYVTKVPFE